MSLVIRDEPASLWHLFEGESEAEWQAWRTLLLGECGRAVLA